MAVCTRTTILLYSMHGPRTTENDELILPPITIKKNHKSSRSSVLLYLNTTNATMLGQNELIWKTRNVDVNHSIDVLIIGSKYKLSAVQTQFETWGSHVSIRHFVVSTEEDDDNPSCLNMTWLNVKSHLKTCQTAKRYWHRVMKSPNGLTEKFASMYASEAWVGRKASPVGWLCAQRRFVGSFMKWMQLYLIETNLPDYLIIVDDDTYMNIQHITEYLLQQPGPKKSHVQSPQIPVVYAGCKRIGDPRSESFWNFPFGGFGTFLSQGSLRRWMRPLHCHKNTTSNISVIALNDDNINDSIFEYNMCQKYLHIEKLSNPHNITIGESHHFKTGDSLNKVFTKYMGSLVGSTQPFCLHSDWFFGYVANYLNLSRIDNSASNLNFVSPNNRLHALLGDSTFYRRQVQGQCMHGNGLGPNKNDACKGNATICHYVNETTMKQIFQYLKA